MDRNRVQTQHHLERPDIVRRQWFGTLGWFGHDPSPLRPGCRVRDLLRHIQFNHLGWLSLLLRDRRTRVISERFLLGHQDFKNGPPRLFYLNALFSPPFAFGAGSDFRLLPHQLVGIDRWGHFRYLSCQDKVRMIDRWTGWRGLGHEQNYRFDGCLLWSRNRRTLEEVADLRCVAKQQWCRPWLPQSVYQNVGRKNFGQILKIDVTFKNLQPRRIWKKTSTKYIRIAYKLVRSYKYYS